MPTVHRWGSLRFVIFVNDHGPPHVHVFGPGAEAKIELEAAQHCPSLIWARGFDRKTLRQGDGRSQSVSQETARCMAAIAWQRIGPTTMARDWMDREIDRARARGRRRVVIGEPRASDARYDRRTGRIMVDLTNGCSFVFPARSLQGLERASDAELADLEILGAGHGLHWKALDADFTVPGLLMGVFGTRSWMLAELARRAGQMTSPTKAAAARANGRKGGRPRRASA